MNPEIDRFCRAFVHETSDAIVYADSEDRIGFWNIWNKGAGRIFGFAASEAIGKSLDIIIPENIRKRHWDGFEERAAPPSRSVTPSAPRSVVILGGGAAGNAAAEALRDEGYSGRITMISADESIPYDQPNLSKDYLAGNAPEDGIPLRSPDFYEDHAVDLKLRVYAVAVGVKKRQVVLTDGSQHE